MRILLLEDEPKVSALVKRGLTAERYAVDVTADGREGLEYTEAYPYDLILLDLMLPSLSGVEVLQRIRRNNQYVPILVLTARDSIDDKVKLFEIGADDYLTKPFAFDELLARVEALVRRGSGQAEPTTLTYDDLVLDLQSRKVTRGGKPLDLQAREFALLEYLMRNAGRVVTKTMILSHIWDYAFDPQTNVVDVLVCRVRNKVEKGYDKKLIKTLRGMGYVLEGS